jgi:hypothetical protein
MPSFNDTSTPPRSPSFSFAALIAALFQLRLRDKLSAANRDDGAHIWGL